MTETVSDLATPLFKECVCGWACGRGNALPSSSSHPTPADLPSDQSAQSAPPPSPGPAPPPPPSRPASPAPPRLLLTPSSSLLSPSYRPISSPGVAPRRRQTIISCLFIDSIGWRGGGRGREGGGRSLPPPLGSELLVTFSSQRLTPPPQWNQPVAAKCQRLLEST